MSDDQESQNSADRTENVDPNGPEEANLLSPMVSTFEKALERVKSELRKVRTVADDAMSTAFRTNSEVRERVYSAINEQVQLVECQLDIVRALALKNKQALSRESKEVVALLCDLYGCDAKQVVHHAIKQEEKIEMLQAQLLRSKAADREKLQERRRMILAGQEPMESELNEQNTCNDIYNTENIQRTPRMTLRTMGSSSNGQQGQFHSLRSSSSSSDESELSLQSELSTARLMNEYMRAAAMPDVKPFANRKGEKFTDFLRQFRLKYPETTWRDSERRDILVGLLEGEARMHYKTLPKDVRNGSLQALIEGMKRRLKVDGPEEQAKAMRKLRTLRKKGDQSVLQFCLELETLSCKAYPNADDHTLSLMRAEILQEQLSHWTEAIQLLEILETETCGEVYEKMRETALRIERLRENSSLGRAHRRHWDFRAKGPPQGMNGSNKAASTPDKQDGKKLNGRAPQRTQKDVTCTNCGKRGHEAQECWSRKSDRQAVSFSATLDTWCCKTIQSKAGNCVEVGGKYMVTLTCLGAKESGMIDSGSQITIIPLEILKRARDRGQDMDRLCTQVPLPDVNAYDASGNRMDFLGCVQLNLGLEGRGEHPVRAYVKKLNDNVILLGTNVLRTLGIHIGIERCTSTEDEGCTTRSGWQETLHPIQGDAMPVRQNPLQEPLRKKSNVVKQEGQKSRVDAQESSQQEPEETSREATVVKRVYLSPGQCALIQVQGNGQKEDAALCSVNANIPTGVCEFSQNGTTEVPVLNHTSQPIVFQEGQKIGVWEEVDWIQAATKDIESDMLELHEEPQHKSERIATLLDHLQRNRKCGHFSERLLELVENFQDVFALTDKELTQTDLIEHNIDTGDTKAIKQRTRPVPQGVRSELKSILNDLEERKIIKKSTSDWASPIVLVQKKDKTLRLCIDYRALNKHTKQDSYPLPITDTLLQSLGGKKFFSTLDMASGYWQVKLAEDAQQKSAFTTPEGLYEFLVLPFGLCTSPAVFQRLMDRVLGDLKGEEVLVYIDDILVATDTEERHLQILAKVFEAFRKANLKFKPQKCLLMEQQVSFLGHIINERGVNMDPDKVVKILNYPKPANLAELRTFLGLCGYYRKFVLRFSSIAKPLFDLTNARAPYEWNSEQELAFGKLKSAIASAPVLGQPDIEKAKSGEKPYIIYTDASTTGVGAVLCQEGADNLLHPLYFASKKLSKAEQRYHITDIEALAIIYAVKKFHFFIFGVKTIVRTDHQPLTTLFKRNNVSPRVIRWALELQAYNLEIQYVKGSANKVADALSRGLSDDNGYVEEPEEIRVVSSIDCESEWLQELKKDDDYREIIEKLQRGDTEDEVQLPRQQKKFKVCDFCIVRGNLNIILEDGSLAKVVPKSKRFEVFKETHAGSFSGHFNARKIAKFLKKRVFWEGLQQDLVKWCAECRNCFLTNDRTNKPPPLKPFEVAKPFEVIGIDVLEVGPSSSGMKYLVVVIDHFSKWLGAYPVPCKSAEEIAKVVFKRWIAEGGRWPKRIHSDRGKEFENSVMDALCRITGIKQSFTKGYNPRENGVTERANKTILRMLKKRGGIVSEWDEAVPHVVYAYNISPHEATNESPFFILHGFDPVFPSNIIPSDELSPYRIDIDDYKASLMSGIKAIQEIVTENNEAYRSRMKKYYDSTKGVDPTRAPKVGDRVLMRMPTEKGKTKHPKLTIDWAGPYRVVEVSSNSAVITKINANEEPLQVQFDLLRVIPHYIDDTPVVTVSKRRRTNIAVKSVQLNEKVSFRSGLKQLVLAEDTRHPLHLQFICNENQLVKPPGDYKGYRIGFKCPLVQEEVARKLSNVLHDLPETMRDITFNSTARLAELITIWMREDWSDDHKLFMMAKHNARTKISGEALALALLYCKKKCLHIQLSLENLSPEDVYHEAIQCDEGTFRVSGMMQAALKLIAGKEWKEPYKKKKRQQYLLTPRCLSKVHTMLENTINGIAYDIQDLPKIAINSDVLLIVGVEETDADDVTNKLVPWIEDMASDDIQIAIGVAPMEHQTQEHERKWTRVYQSMEVAVDNLRRVVNNVTLLPDAQPGEWDHPHRSLGTAPYDQNGVIGFYATRRWYDSIRKFWVPGWPALTEKPQKEEEAPPQRKRMHDDDDTVYPPRKMNPQKHCYRGKRLGPHHK